MRGVQPDGADADHARLTPTFGMLVWLCKGHSIHILRSLQLRAAEHT